MFSEGCVLSLVPRTKELLSNGFAIILGQCTPEVGGQDVLVKLLVEAGEVFSMDKDLQGRQGDGSEQGGTLRMRLGEKRNRRTKAHMPSLPGDVLLRSPLCCAAQGIHLVPNLGTEPEEGSGRVPSSSTLIPLVF